MKFQLEKFCKMNDVYKTHINVLEKIWDYYKNYIKDMKSDGVDPEIPLLKFDIGGTVNV